MLFDDRLDARDGFVTHSHADTVASLPAQRQTPYSAAALLFAAAHTLFAEKLPVETAAVYCSVTRNK